MYKNIEREITLLLFIAISLIAFSQNKTLSPEAKRKFDYFFYKAQNAKTQSKYDVAFDYLRHCNSIDSANAEVNYQLAESYSIFGQKDKAMNLYRKAMNLNRGNYYYTLAYGNICLETKQYTDAVGIYSRLIKSYPNNTELYVLLSNSYRLLGDSHKAIDALNRLESIIGLNEKISMQKFQLYTLLNQEDKAFDEIQKYIKKYPTEIRYQILLGNLYMQAGRANDAFITYSKAKAYDPEDPYLIVSMAEYYEHINNKEAAESELHTALISTKLDIGTKLAILAQYITTLQENEKDTKSANALFDTLIVQHPQEPELNLMYGNLLMIQERKDEARFQYQIYTDANPTKPAGWEQLLMTAFPDSVDLCIDICKKALTYNPEAPQFYFYLGISEFLKKDYIPALTSLNEGVKYTDKSNPKFISDFYGQIGDIYHQIEKKDSAYISYEKALKFNPGNIGVLNNYSYFLSLDKKDLDKAEKMSSMTVKAEPSNPTYLDTYGWVLFQRKEYTFAKIYIEKAIQYSKEEELSSEVLEHYGDVLFMTGEKEKAIEYWKKAFDKEQTEDKTEHKKSKTLNDKIEKQDYIAE